MAFYSLIAFAPLLALRAFPARRAFDLAFRRAFVRAGGLSPVVGPYFLHFLRLRRNALRFQRCAPFFRKANQPSAFILHE